MRVDTPIVGCEFEMIFTEKTFSLRCQLQILDGSATFVFLAPIFSCSRLVVIMIKYYRLKFLVVI